MATWRSGGRRGKTNAAGCVLLVAPLLLVGLLMSAWKTCGEVVDYKMSQPKKEHR